nr:uncharacterized protein LOC109191079 [Ipomoea batatas]
MAVVPQNAVVLIHATTHFPIRLTSSNFLIWKKQVESTLIGLDLVGYITGSVVAPARYTDQAQTVANPNYATWLRQDNIILSALLGSLSDTLQPVIASANSACDAWVRLSAFFVSQEQHLGLHILLNTIFRRTGRRVPPRSSTNVEGLRARNELTELPSPPSATASPNAACPESLSAAVESFIPFVGLVGRTTVIVCRSYRRHQLAGRTGGKRGTITAAAYERRTFAPRCSLLEEARRLLLPLFAELTAGILCCSRALPAVEWEEGATVFRHCCLLVGAWAREEKGESEV